MTDCRVSEFEQRGGGGTTYRNQGPRTPTWGGQLPTAHFTKEAWTRQGLSPRVTL